MDDYIRSVRLRAYLIWERAGQRKAVMLNIGIRRKGKWRRKRMLLACGRRVRTTRVSGSSKNPVESKERLKWPSRHLRARSRNELERAQETAQRTSKGDDAAGRR